MAASAKGFHFGLRRESFALLAPSILLPEWLAWFAYFLFALGSPWGWITFYCPLLMFYSLTTANALLPRPPEDAIDARSPTPEMPEAAIANQARALSSFT